MTAPKMYSSFVRKLPIGTNSKHWLLRHWILTLILLIVITTLFFWLYHSDTVYDTSSARVTGETFSATEYSLGYNVCFLWCSYNKIVSLYTTAYNTKYDCILFSVVTQKRMYCDGIGGTDVISDSEINTINNNRANKGLATLPILGCDEANKLATQRAQQNFKGDSNVQLGGMVICVD